MYYNRGHEIRASPSEVMGGPTKPGREISVVQSHEAAFLEMIGICHLMRSKTALVHRCETGSRNVEVSERPDREVGNMSEA